MAILDLGSNGTEVKNSANAGTASYQTHAVVSSDQKMQTISRLFVGIATKNKAMPMPDGNSFWIIQGKDGSPALEPIQGSLLAVPVNAILSISLEDCMGLLFYTRNKLMPDMSEYSGIQVNVVHTEAVYDSEKGTINTEMSLYPTQYVPISAVTVKQKDGQDSKPASEVLKNSGSEVTGTEAKQSDSNSTNNPLTVEVVEESHGEEKVSEEATTE